MCKIAIASKNRILSRLAELEALAEQHSVALNDLDTVKSLVEQGITQAHIDDVVHGASTFPGGGEFLTLYLIGIVFFAVGVFVYNFTKRKYIFYI